MWRKPNPARRQTLVGSDELWLAELCHAVADRHPALQRFNPRNDLWQRYFQSPVDKAAHTLDQTDRAIRFNQQGVLTTRSNAGDLLLRWLEFKPNKLDEEGEAIQKWLRQWLKDDKTLDDSVLERIRNKLKEETLENHDLYNQPVCRL